MRFGNCAIIRTKTNEAVRNDGDVFKGYSMEKRIVEGGVDEGDSGRVTYTLRVNPFVIGSEKSRILKPLEESAEVLGAWQDRERGVGDRQAILYECCDVIQAACNALASLGATQAEVEATMSSVHEHNFARGRYARRGDGFGASREEMAATLRTLARGTEEGGSSLDMLGFGEIVASVLGGGSASWETKRALLRQLADLLDDSGDDDGR